MLGKALCGHYGLDERRLLRTPSLALAAGLDPIVFTHDGSALADGKHWSELAAGKSDYKEDRVVLLLRDPKDAIVSSYFQATRRLRVFDGTLSQFVRSERFGDPQGIGVSRGLACGSQTARSKTNGFSFFWVGRKLMGADQSVEATACFRARLQLVGRLMGAPSRSRL